MSNNNYVSQMINLIIDELPDIPLELASLYALLALTRGINTTLEDVHDAWAVWTAATRNKLDHPSLIPFKELTTEIQELDREYMNGIHRAAQREIKYQEAATKRVL